MSLKEAPTESPQLNLDSQSYPLPLSSDEVVNSEDVDNLHAIISNSHLEEDEEAELERALEAEFPGTAKAYFEADDAEYLPYEEHRSGDVVLSFNIWDIVRKGAINIALPFVNGIMLGFGEILAHEIGFHFGFFGARVQPPRRLEERRRSRFQSS